MDWSPDAWQKERRRLPAAARRALLCCAAASGGVACTDQRRGGRKPRDSYEQNKMTASEVQTSHRPPVLDGLQSVMKLHHGQPMICRERLMAKRSEAWEAVLFLLRASHTDVGRFSRDGEGMRWHSRARRSTFRAILEVLDCPSMACIFRSEEEKAKEL